MKRHYIPVTADVPGVSDGTKSFLRKVIRTALDQQGVDVPCEVDVYVTGDAGIQELNREMRQVDRPTDVLSFPQFEDLTEDIPEVGEICLGDVVICREKAEEQAEEFGHSFERELVYLFTHSVLHLLGYDHMEEDEKKVMRQREEEIMEQIGLMRQEGLK